MPFDFNGYQIRVIQDDQGEPWFVAKDVAGVLGYTDTNQAVRNHCKYPKLLKGVESTGLTSSRYGINIIKEADVYRLIIKSRLPQAEAFEEWVMEEVLPSIRKTGSYSATPAPANPLDVMQAMLDQMRFKVYKYRHC